MGGKGVSEFLLPSGHGLTHGRKSLHLQSGGVNCM